MNADQPISSPSDPTMQKDVATDLKAALAARRELGDEMEDHVVESFLARVEEQIDRRVSQRLAERGEVQSAKKEKGPGKYEAAAVVGSSLVLAIPLIGVSGSNESVPIMGIILAVNALYFKFRFGGR